MNWASGITTAKVHVITIITTMTIRPLPITIIPIIITIAMETITIITDAAF